MEVGSTGFPSVKLDSESSSGSVAIASKPIPLTEPSNVLALLFSFLYPKKVPETLGDIFETVLGVAEAAEKYRVHLAILVCKKLLG